MLESARQIVGFNHKSTVLSSRMCETRGLRGLLSSRPLEQVGSNREKFLISPVKNSWYHPVRYIPVGLLERLPQQINDRPPPFYGRDDLETLLASNNCADWIKIRY